MHTMFSLAYFCSRAFSTDFLTVSEVSLEAPPMMYRAIAAMPVCKRIQMLNKHAGALPFSQRDVSETSARLHWDTLDEARVLSRARVSRCCTSTGFSYLAPPSLRLHGIYCQPPERQLSLRERRKGMVSVL